MHQFVNCERTSLESAGTRQLSFDSTNSHSNGAKRCKAASQRFMQVNSVITLVFAHRSSGVEQWQGRLIPQQNHGVASQPIICGDSDSLFDKTEERRAETWALYHGFHHEPIMHSRMPGTSCKNALIYYGSCSSSIHGSSNDAYFCTLGKISSVARLTYSAGVNLVSRIGMSTLSSSSR